MINKVIVSRLVFFLLTLTMLSSCVDTKNSTYFVYQRDATLESTTVTPDVIIAPNNLLGITVSSLNPEATVIFNKPHSPNEEGSGYLVNKEGKIQFPVLGEINAQGFTPNQLAAQISKILVDRKLLVDPTVTVRFLNFKVTVLGEVAHPTVIDVPNEKIALLEALGMAGDITVYGKKDNVLLIREEGNKKIVKRINLNTSELFNSPYYYLKANDIVYVEANKAKVASTSRATQLLPVVITALSFAAIVADRLIK